MTLKNKAAVTYLLPLLLSYCGVVAALAVGKGGPSSEYVLSALPASGLLILSHLLQDVLPKPAKETLVFYRLKSRLPGHRAFSEICKNDPRISQDYLSEKLNDTGGKPEAQNREWYALYRDCASEPSVVHENLRYLAWRDATIALMFLGIFTPILSAMDILAWVQVTWIALGCFALSLVTAAAARNAASALVRNAIAVASSPSPASDKRI